MTAMDTIKSMESPIAQAVGNHRIPLLRKCFEAVEAIATDITRRNGNVGESHSVCLVTFNELIKELK